jgi:phosphohistidine phosphatase
MDVVILMRHGKAVRDHEAPSDRERGLTARGRNDAKAAGAMLRESGLAPDRILVSSAERTRQTYAALGLSIAPAATFEDDLYMASADAIWNAAERSGGSTVLVIGHNPGLHELAADLAEQTHERSAATKSLRQHLPTSAFAVFSIAGSRRRAAGPRLLAIWTPKD